jgi:hypothetical protein
MNEVVPVGQPASAQNASKYAVEAQDYVCHPCEPGRLKSNVGDVCACGTTRRTDVPDIRLKSPGLARVADVVLRLDGVFGGVLGAGGLSHRHNFVHGGVQSPGMLLRFWYFPGYRVIPPIQRVQEM